MSYWSSNQDLKQLKWCNIGIAKLFKRGSRENHYIIGLNTSRSIPSLIKVEDSLKWDATTEWSYKSSLFTKRSKQNGVLSSISFSTSNQITTSKIRSHAYTWEPQDWLKFCQLWRNSGNFHKPKLSSQELWINQEFAIS